MIEISRQQIVAKLKELGISQGAVLFVHSSLGLIFGRQNDSCNLLHSAIREVIGPSGTLAVPAFTTDCCHDRLFDPDTTDSSVGIFSNWVRKLPGAIRSHHPIHSVAAIGPKAGEITDHESQSSFGAESSFKKLVRLNAINLMVGVGIRYLSLIHQVEEELQVPYRFYKNFKIAVRIDHHEREIVVPYYARYLDRQTEYRFPAMSEALRREGAYSTIRIGWGEIGRCDFVPFNNLFSRLMKEDPYFSIDKELYLNSIKGPSDET